MWRTATVSRWRYAGGAGPRDEADPDTGPARARGPDWMLRSGLLISGLLIGYQVTVTLIRPSWIGPATDWLRVALAWPGVVVLLVVSAGLARTRRPVALPWWLLTVSMLGYALGKTLQVVFDRVVVPGTLPFPWWSDVIALLAFPGFFLAPVLWPGVLGHRRVGLARAKLLLDTLLVVGAVAILSWYFFLAPLVQRSAASWQAKAVDVAYPVADLGGCFALAMVLLRPHRDVRYGAVLRLLLLTAGCLILADSWTLWLRLYAPAGSDAVPNLLYVLGSLLLPLAGLVQYRRLRRPMVAEDRPTRKERSLTRRDLRACFRLLLPFVVALLASAALEARMLFAPVAASGQVTPRLLILLLLLLALARQAAGFLDYVHIQRERDVERANAQTWRETTRQIETFVSIAGHELKTPLTSLQGNLELMARRIDRVHPDTAQAGDLVPLVTTMRTMVEYSQLSVGRLGRLINDLLDHSRIRQGRLEYRQEPCDLTTIVTRAVEEQRHLAPERTILLVRPVEAPVPVCGDAERLGQLVTNLLTNALKYSPEACPVEVGVQEVGRQGRVWVRDQGPGIPECERAHLWEPFFRVPGVEVQCGSGVGLGLGLHISKTIAEHHGGQVGVQSAPGAGSTFWFTLPLVGR